MSDININAVYTQLRDAQILVTIYLMNGFQLHGVIVAFDQEVVAIKSDSRILIVYKHAISTLVPKAPFELR